MRVFLGRLMFSLCIGSLGALSPALAYTPKQVVNRFSDPSVLQWVGVQSSVPVVTLQIDPKTVETRLVALTINKIRKKTLTINGVTQIIVQVPLNEKSRVEAWIYEKKESGAVLESKSSPLTIDTTWWQSRKMKVAGLTTNGVVAPGLKNIKIKAFSPAAPQLISAAHFPQTHIKINVDGALTYEAFHPLGGTPKLPHIEIPLGKHQLELMVGNAWGGYQSWRQKVYHFGLPLYGRNYGIVNQESKQLFVIKNKRFHKVYPIGIGAKETPTPEGAFQLGEIAAFIDEKTKTKQTVLELFDTDFELHSPGPGESVGKANSKGDLVMGAANLVALNKVLKAGSQFLILKDLGADMLKEPKMEKKAKPKPAQN